MDTPFRTYTQQVTSHLRHVTPQEKQPCKRNWKRIWRTALRPTPPSVPLPLTDHPWNGGFFSWNINNRWSTHLCRFFPLLRDQDRYGCEMISELERRSDHTFQMKEGTLYPVLKKLEAGGCVTSYPAEANGRTRKYYRITQRGPCPAGPGNRRLGAIRPRHPFGFGGPRRDNPPFPQAKTITPPARPAEGVARSCPIIPCPRPLLPPRPPNPWRTCRRSWGK